MLSRAVVVPWLQGHQGIQEVQRGQRDPERKQEDTERFRTQQIHPDVYLYRTREPFLNGSLCKYEN